MVGDYKQNLISFIFSFFMILTVFIFTYTPNRKEKTSDVQTQKAQEIVVISVCDKEVLEEEPITEEVMLLAKTICAEAGYNNKLDMFLVGNVIMNRLESPHYPNANTIYDVIYQEGQYACTWDGNLEKAEPNDLAIEIATRLIRGERLAPENVIFQAQFKQGDGTWLKVGGHYYCYKDN